jgi:receptor protein-tyrosine kinase
LAVCIIGVVGGNLITSQKATYAAGATIYVGASNFSIGSSQGATAAYSSTILATLLPTYQQMLGSAPVAADAAQRAGFNLTGAYIQAHTSISNKAGTTLLDIRAVDANPTIAQVMANSVADAFAAKVQSLQPSSSAGSLPTAPAYVFERAGLPAAPLPTKTFSNMVKGLLIGLLVGIGLAMLLEYLDVTVKGPSDAEVRLGLSVLGVIPLRRTDA